MIDNQERRAQGAARIPVEALVEICGNDPGIPAFEAEAVNVSGRGMHLTTAYLPEEGAPLVCRFEDRGREIIVEGEVVWRKEEARGGEFGIRFTALDSSSVEALRDLCDSRSQPPPPASQDSPTDGPQASETGSRVRLHIDGLGSPMKARVRDSGARKVQVGSNLEFLKVGRRLEIEDLEFNEKRRAHIDSVNVVVDPQSQVPQLVVALRYDDLPEATPEPSVIDSEVQASESAFAPAVAAIDAGTATTTGSSEAPLQSTAAEDEVLEEVSALRNKLDNVAVRAGVVAKSTGVVLARASASAAQGMGKLFQGASAKVLEFKKRRGAASPPRRTTAPPQSGVPGNRGHRLRPQSSAPEMLLDQSSLEHKARVKRIAALASLAVLLLAVSALALHHKAPPPGAHAQLAQRGTSVAHDVKPQGNPVPTSTAPAAGHKGRPVANVPLFGPTPMATLEPAPLGPAPEPSASAPTPNSEEAAELAAAKAAPAAADQVFVDDQPTHEVGHAVKRKAVRPRDVSPWGRGHVHMPTVYKLRLDKPGSAIEGAVRPTGFTVLIPDCKVRGSTRTIVKRDHRIARVSKENTSHGAQITFQFRDGVPGYRVRLRHHYVEFLISAPNRHSSRHSAKSRHHARSKHHHVRRSRH